MKKILATTVLVTITAISFAQKHSKDLRIGFKLEPNISWFHPVENGVKSDGSKVGINYGLMLDYEFADNYILSTGLQVSQAGGKLSYTTSANTTWDGNHVGYISADTKNNGNTANYNVRIQYLEIPFAIKLKSNNKGKIEYWGSFGGFLAFPLKSRADVQTNFSVGGSLSNFSKENDNVLSYTQPINIGMQIGAGVHIPISETNILVAGLVFNNGFIDVTKNGSWGGDGRININNIALKLGVLF